MKLSKERFEFFSDGVMAIIITIMALEIPVGCGGLRGLIEPLLIFFTSFFIVGTFWSRHLLLTSRIPEITKKMIWRNLLFLFFLALIPIFTKWIIESRADMASLIGYNIVFLCANLSYSSLFHATFNEGEMDKLKVRMLKNRIAARTAQWHKHQHQHFLLFVIFVFLIFVFPKFAMILYMIFPIASSIISLFANEFPRRK